MPQTGLEEEKILWVERWRYVGDEGDVIPEVANEPDAIQYRLGYFVRGRIGRAAGRWTWGQYAPLIPADDLTRLLELARSDGTLLAELD